MGSAAVGQGAQGNPLGGGQLPEVGAHSLRLRAAGQPVHLQPRQSCAATAHTADVPDSSLSRTQAGKQQCAQLLSLTDDPRQQKALTCHH